MGVDQILNSRGYLIKDWIQKNFSTEEYSKIKLRPRDPSKIACVEADILAGGCQSYFSIEVISSGRQMIFTRTYRGVLETIGDIGDLKEVVYLVFSLLYSMYNFNNRILKSKLVAEDYGVKKEKKLGKWCKKKIMDIGKNETILAKNLGLADQENKNYAKMQKFKGGLFETNDSVFELALANLQSSLDVGTICKEINILKVLRQLLLTDYQTKIIPLTALNSAICSSRNIENFNGDLIDKKSDIKVVMNTVRVGFESHPSCLTSAEAYYQLFEAVEKSKSESPELRNIPRKTLDRVYTRGPSNNSISEQLISEYHLLCWSQIEKGKFVPFEKPRAT